ncbi:hypothetical protein DMB92_04960 [Campylobacter sp. MIT 99-7217]|nr:hypothetical protein DMB92_04960 [Campylobacter sp. MIT 99-7217]
MLALSTYNVVDGAFVGQKLGQDALAAVGIAWPVFPMLIAYELLFSIGAASLCSYYLGKNEPEKAREIFSSVFYFALLSGVILGFIFYVYCDEIVILLGASEKIAPLASEFLEIIFLGSFVIVLHPLLDIFAMNDKRPVLAMIAMIVGAISNIAFNYLFIFVLEIGIAGSALATILGHFMGFLILLWHFVFKRGQVFFVLSFKIKALIRSTQNSIAQASAELSAALVLFIANHLLVGLGGDRAVAMYSVMMYSGIVLFTTLLSASQAIQPIASFNFGANIRSRVLNVLKFGLLFSFAMGVILYLLSIMFSKYLVILFLQKDANGSVDMVFLNDVQEAMKIYFAGFAMLGFNMAAASFFQAIQRPISSFIITSCYTLIFVLIFFTILPNFFGLKGIWTSYPLAQFCSFIISLAVLFYAFKKGGLNPNHFSRSSS